MFPFNKFSTGVLMAAAPVLPGGGGDPNALPPAPGQPPPAPPADPAIARLTAEVQRNRQEVDRLQRQVMQPSSTPPQGPSRQDMDRQFIQSPVDMTVAIAQRVTQEAIQRHGAAGFDTQVEMARTLARGSGEDAVLFDRYQAEIESSVAQVDIPLRANASVWKNAFNLVKGQHIADIVAAARAATPDPPGSPAVHIRSGDGPAPPRAAAPNHQATAEKLSDEEAKFAKKFRMDPQDYLKAKKSNLSQSDFIMDPLGKSSWDDYITFDSRDARRKAREERKAKNAKNTTTK